MLSFQRRRSQLLVCNLCDDKRSVILYVDDDNIEYDEDGNAIIPEKKVTVACV